MQQNALFRRLAHVMEWGVVSRSCIPVGFVLALYSLHLAWALLMLHLPGGQAVLNFRCFDTQRWVILGLTLGAGALLLLGLWLRRRQPDALWFSYLSTCYYGLSLAWGGYLTGTLNMATGVVLMGAPIVGFLLLERRVVLFALGLSFATILGFNIGSALGYLPYAPLLLSPQDRASALLWVLSQMLLATPHILACVIQAALILQQWRLREANALSLSLTDALTGTHNRRSILELLGRELARASRRGQPLSLVLLDLDHFKEINDRWGHPVGDRVLRDTAGQIGAVIRPGDALGRFGGEEFLLVLPATTRDQAALLVERCRQQLIALSTRADGGEPVPVRASFGLAWTEAGSNADALIRAADQALYAAKAAGRDRLVVAPAPCTAGTSAATPQPLHADRVAGPRRRDLLQPAGWRRLLAGILEWSPVAKAALVMGLSLFMALNYWGWLLLALPTGEVAPGVARFMLRVVPMAALFCLVAIFAGLLLRRRHADARWYLRITLHVFGLVLVAIGYTFGMLYMPTGVLMICSLLLGFILFGQALVLEVFAASAGVVVALAFASAFGLIPYAPLLSVHGTAWQMTSPFWMASNYFFTCWAMLIVLVLTDRLLGRWRQREQEVLLLGRTDALTQVSNRRHILAQLERHLQQSRRDGMALTVVLLDLDHFKRINDRWGHPTGDRALRTAARVLTSTLRQGDEVGRYGGEEFMLLLRDTAGSGAAALVERCRATLAAASVISDTGEPIALSASFGVASQGAGEQVEGEQLIRSADHALYRAKAGGRNRVEQAPELLTHYGT